ncbi:MAG: hypothetical protein QOI92_358 [Chloroflexota bacterium]|nr:hypothetical protein [Chloroflexota bacterium]
MIASPVRRQSAAALVIIGFVLGGMLGFAVGAKVGSAPPQASSAPPIHATADVQPDSVSQRLRDAYYGNGGALQVCLIGVEVVCHRATPWLSARAYTDITRALDSAELAALAPTSVPTGRNIVAGDFGPVDGASIVRLDPGGPTDSWLLVVVNPDRQGIGYVDLGELGQGTYLVALDVPSWRGSPTAMIELAVQ